MITKKTYLIHKGQILDSRQLLPLKSSIKRIRPTGNLCKGLTPWRSMLLNYNSKLHHLQYQFALKQMIRSSQPEAIINNLTLSSVKYEMKEDPFVVPIKFKKEVPLNKNIFELNEPLPKNYALNDTKKGIEQSEMPDPVSMDSATIKLLLVQKLNAYISVLSILISVYQLYYVQEDQQQMRDYLLLFSTSMTAFLLIQVLTAAYFHYVNQEVRHYSQKEVVATYLPIILVVLLAPNPYTRQFNKYFHLTLLLRVYFPLKYSIHSSMYYDSRSARITNLYGIKPQLTFKFALKVILNQKSISNVLTFYFGIVLFYSHCLYVISDHIPFIDCFEVVIATLPTIGYGEIAITGIPRTIILCILLTGVPLNAFVTFVMLKHFEMSTNQKNSYILMEKLNMMEELKGISSNFIIQKIKNRKAFLNKTQDIDTDENFKEKFNQCKIKYRNLNPHDSIYQFNYFKDMLNDLKIKMLQTNNMVNVLVARLASTQKHEKRPLKTIESDE